MAELHSEFECNETASVAKLKLAGYPPLHPGSAPENSNKHFIGEVIWYWDCILLAIILQGYFVTLVDDAKLATQLWHLGSTADLIYSGHIDS